MNPGQIFSQKRRETNMETGVIQRRAGGSPGEGEERLLGREIKSFCVLGQGAPRNHRFSLSRRNRLKSRYLVKPFNQADLPESSFLQNYPRSPSKTTKLDEEFVHLYPGRVNMFVIHG